MKKQTFVIIFALITTVSLYGCSKANIEKESITIENTRSSQIIEANAADLSEDTEDIIASTKNNVSKEETDFINDSEVSTSSETESNNNEKKAKETTSKNTTSLTFEIEGMKETIKGTYFNNKMLGYNIVYDESKFKYSSSEGSDSFMAENPDPEIYPYVYLNISRVEEKTTLNKYTKKMKEALLHGYKKVTQLSNTIIGDNYEAVHLKAIAGHKWNSAVRDLYLLESNGSIYLIEKQYFVEAEEGYGARMHAMIDTFKFN